MPLKRGIASFGGATIFYLNGIPIKLQDINPCERFRIAGSPPRLRAGEEPADRIRRPSVRYLLPLREGLGWEPAFTVTYVPKFRLSIFRLSIFSLSAPLWGRSLC